MIPALLYAAVAAAVIALAAAIENTSPRALARHLRQHPGALLAAAFGGAAVGITCWALGLLTDQLTWHVPQSRAYLGITAAMWAGIHLVLDTSRARRQAAAKAARRAARSAPAPRRHRATGPSVFQPRPRPGENQ